MNTPLLLLNKYLLSFFFLGGGVIHPRKRGGGEHKMHFKYNIHPRYSLLYILGLVGTIDQGKYWIRIVNLQVDRKNIDFVYRTGITSAKNKWHRISTR